MSKGKTKSEETVAPAAEPTSEALAVSAVAPTTLARAHDYGDDMGMGFEDAGKGLIPWIVLFQSNSPQVEEGLVPGAKAGNLFNSSTNELIDAEVPVGEPIGERGLIIQPVWVQRTFVEWIPRTSGGGIAGRYEFTDPHVQAEIRRNGTEIFGKENPMHGKVDVKNNIADTRYLYFNIISNDGSDVDGIGVIACAGSKIKPIEQLVSAVRNAKGQPSFFAALVRLTTFQDKQKKPPNKVFKNIRFNTFDRRLDLPVEKRSQRFDINTLLDVTDPLYERGRAFYQQLKSGELKADAEKEATVNAGGGAEGEDAGEKRAF